MNKLQEIVEKTLLPFGQKVSRNIYMIAVKNGMIKITPLTLIGSLFLILAKLPSIITFIPKYSESVYNILNLPYTICYGILGVVAAMSIAYSLAEQYEDVDSSMTLIAALLVYIVVCAPFSEGFIDVTYLGAPGMFVGIFIGIFVAKIIKFVKDKNLVIKLPESVPHNILTSFEAIIPIGIALGIFYILSITCQSLTEMLIPQFINELLKPAISGIDSLWFILIIMFCVQVLFFFGIHGSSILFGFITPFAIANIAENAAAYAEGLTPVKAFTLITLFIGGYTYSVIAVLLMRCKSKRLKAVGKIGLIPSIFNIQEPIQYGAPIVLNPILFIPYVLTNAIGVAMTYIAMDTGLVACAVVNIPGQTPQPFLGLLSTLDWKSIILWVVLVAVNFVIWKPFIAVYDKQVLLEDGE